jgi:hypothetical protein
LVAEELRAKIRARDEIYLSLRDQAGPEFSKMTAEHLTVEEVALGGDPFVSPRAAGRELRCEWQAKLLKHVGVIDEIIARAGYFIPTARSLLANHSISTGVFAAS